MCLFELSEITQQERKLARLLQDAFQTARNGHIISRTGRRLTRKHACHQLWAVNEKARVAWGNAVCQQVESHFDIAYEHLHPDEPIYLVTLVDLACCTAIDAKSIDLNYIDEQLRYGLSSLSFIGMIEPALYVNIAPGTNVQTKTLVSWHLHAIAWGKSWREMSRLISRCNRMKRHYRPIARDFAGADVRTIKKDTLPQISAYILKSPTNSYRIANWYRKTRSGERRDGFRQNKGLLRPGERVTLFRLMKNMRLDELTMAGGEGVRLLRRAKRRVRKSFD